MSLLGIPLPPPNSPHTLTTNLAKKEAFVLGHLRLQGEERGLQVKGYIKVAAGPPPQNSSPTPFPEPRLSLNKSSALNTTYPNRWATRYLVFFFSCPRPPCYDSVSYP